MPGSYPQGNSCFLTPDGSVFQLTALTLLTLPSGLADAPALLRLHDLPDACPPDFHELRAGSVGETWRQVENRAVLLVRVYLEDATEGRGRGWRDGTTFRGGLRPA